MIELILLALSTPSQVECHPSYPDLCLPADRDVNCSDIPDNQKPVRVTGKDDHRLDKDGDGWGCELNEGKDGDRH
jgi:hypothetical protein